MYQTQIQQDAQTIAKVFKKAKKIRRTLASRYSKDFGSSQFNSCKMTFDSRTFETSKIDYYQHFDDEEYLTPRKCVTGPKNISDFIMEEEDFRISSKTPQGYQNRVMIKKKDSLSTNSDVFLNGKHRSGTDKTAKSDYRSVSTKRDFKIKTTKRRALNMKSTMQSEMNKETQLTPQKAPIKLISLTPKHQIKKLSSIMNSLLVDQEKKFRLITENEEFELLDSIPLYLKVSLANKISLSLSKQRFLKVYLSESNKEPTDKSAEKVLINPTNIVYELTNSDYLYIKIVSQIDSQVKIKFKNNSNKIQRSEVDRCEEQINLKNFGLGTGNWTDKKARLEKFLHQVKEDEHLQKEFKISTKLQKKINRVPIKSITRDLVIEPKFQHLKIKLQSKSSHEKQQNAKTLREQSQIEQINSLKLKQNKWVLYRIKQEIVTRLKKEQKAKEWRIFQFISFIKAISQIKKIPKDIDQYNAIRIRKHFKYCSQIQISHTWTQYKRKLGDKQPKIQIAASTMLIQKTVEHRAKKVLSDFMRHKFMHLNFQLKTRYFATKVQNIQSHFKSHHDNNAARLQILQYLYTEQISKVQMSFFLKKKLRQEKKLRELKQEVVNSVIQRYLRFCKDQHVYTLLKWRKKLKSFVMTKKEHIYLGFRLAFRQETHRLKLKCSEHGKVNYNTDKMGRRIEFLPGCLDPKQEDLRYVPETLELHLIEQAKTIDDMVACYPKQYQFCPTETILEQMIMRSLEITDINELWNGFHPVTRKDKVTWHPDVLL